MASIKQWDTDWFDQFKSIFPTNLTNLQIYPGDPIAWINRVNVPFGNKAAQRAIRMPDQNVQVAKDVTYLEKDAQRLVQRVDMPAIFDAINIDEEYYAGDVVNALGHVSDLFENFKNGIANLVYNGSASDPLCYGLLDAGAGTGSTTIERPDKCTDITTSGKWDIPGNMFEDIASAETGLENKGFYGPKRLIAPPLVKPLMSSLLTSTVTPYRTWVSSIGQYPITFTPFADPDAAIGTFDVFMVDETAFDLYANPLKVRGFFDNNNEDFKWHWKTRAVLLARPKWDGTDWKKGIVKIDQVDWNT